MTPTGNDRTLVSAPPHVTPELIYDFDYIGDPALLAGPHARMRSLLEEAPPIFYSRWYGGHWVVTRKQDLVAITADTATFSNNSRGIPPVGKDIELIPLTLDPPRHTQYRAPLNGYFSPKGVLPLEATIRQMSNDLIDKVIDRGGCDFLAEIAEPLPVNLFMQMAGMPTDRLAEFRRLAEEATASPDGQVRQKAYVRIGEILADVIKARQLERKDDLISRLLDARIEGKAPTFSEMVNYAVLLFLGGLETVVNAMSWGVRHLAISEGLQAKLRGDPDLIPAMVEEILRLYAVASTVRRVTTDHTIRNVTFKAGDAVLLLIPAVNYDPVAFTNAAACVPGRPEPHATFNSGPHRCLGANLARLELRTFFAEWLRRIPPYRLDPAKPPIFIGGLNLGVRTLPLIWQ